MRLHEQRDKLDDARKRTLNQIQSFLEYLASPKFTAVGIDDKEERDYIRTWEVENCLKNLRTLLQYWDIDFE